MGSYCLQDIQFVWNDEKVLEMDGGGSCPMIWMYFMPLNCTLKNGTYTIKKLVEYLQSQIITER